MLLLQGFRRKSLGQVILRSGTWFVRWFVGLVPAGIPIIEIGPGTGVLTTHLLARSPGLTVVELDMRMILRLRFRVGTPKNLTVIRGNFIHVRRDIISSNFIFGSLPYSGSWQILLMARTIAFRGIFLVQKEQADMLLRPSRRFWMLWPFLKVKMLRSRVGRRMWVRPPKVEGAVIQVQTRSHWMLPYIQEYDMYVKELWRSPNRLLNRGLGVRVRPKDLSFREILKGLRLVLLRSSLTGD